MKDTPVHPVRELQELKPGPEQVVYSPWTMLENGLYQVTVTVRELGTFSGVGRSSKVAKAMAAHLALVALNELFWCSALTFVP